MKKKHIVIIVVVAVIVLAVFITLALKQTLRGFSGGGGSIGVVEVEDVIMTAKVTVKELKSFTEDPLVQAIILRIDSPGGGVAASQEIYDAVKKAREKKKVVVSMGAVAASGGYYIALPADRIVANPSTITGSIGVILEYPVFEELFKKIGIRYEVIKSREHKDIGSPFRTISKEERGLLEGVIKDIYEQFVSVTVENRGLSPDSVYKIADGRILTGHQAWELGLIDTLGTFEDAVEICGDLAGIEHPSLIYPTKHFSFIDYLTKPMEKLLMPRFQYLWK
jgi:protease-4